MIDRVGDKFGIKPERLIADAVVEVVPQFGKKAIEGLAGLGIGFRQDAGDARDVALRDFGRCWWPSLPSSHGCRTS